MICTPKNRPNMYLIHDSKIVEIFCEIDDFCQAFEAYTACNTISGFTSLANQPGPKRRLYASEIMTITVLYQRSGMRCFKYFYEHLILKGPLNSFFPKAVSYTHFLDLIGQSQVYLYLFSIYKCSQSQQTECYYIDSKKLVVCHNKRIKQHKVFKDIAQRGKGSMGWFYGFKIHLVINHLGEIVQFALTAGNVADNNQELLSQMLTGLKGKCYGDKGYLSSLFEDLLNDGLQLVTKVRSNMKNKLMDLKDKILLKKRGLIESVNAVLMSVCEIEHSRHRKPENAFSHIFASLIAYCYLDNKPSIVNKKAAKIAA